METEKFLRKFGTVVLVLGIIGGIIIMFTRVETGFYKTMEFSITNVILGLTGIISSIFWWLLCNWLSDILINSKKKIKLLNEIKEKMIYEEVQYKKVGLDKHETQDPKGW